MSQIFWWFTSQRRIQQVGNTQQPTFTIILMLNRVFGEALRLFTCLYNTDKYIVKTELWHQYNQLNRCDEVKQDETSTFNLCPTITS